MAKMKGNILVWQRCGAMGILLHRYVSVLVRIPKSEGNFKTINSVVCGFGIMGGLTPLNISTSV